MSVVRRAGALLALASVSAACSVTSEPREAEQASQGTTKPTISLAEDQSLPAEGRVRMSAAIYAAVIRKLLADGPRDGRRRVLVRSVIVKGAEDPLGRQAVRAGALRSELRGAIEAELADVGGVSFDASAQPAEEGTLITLGPIRWRNGRTVDVPNSRWPTPDRAGVASG